MYTSYNDPANKSDGLLGLPALMARKKAEKKPVIGSWLMFPGHSVARMTAQIGYDFVLVDCEHGNIDDAAMHVSVATIAANGSSPIVRVPAPDGWLLKRALDTGAHGILCPLMSTPDDARKLVAAAKLPPLRPEYPQLPLSSTSTSNKPSIIGIRGAGSPFAPAVFNQTMKDYVATANRNTLIGVQIETAEGLENCEEIAKVEGVDMLFVGPNDLTAFLGHPSHLHPTLPDVHEAIRRVLKAAHDAGKYAGMFCTSAEEVKKWWEEGFDFMNLGADVIAVGAWNAQQLGALSDLR